jgi:hypothetical protein
MARLGVIEVIIVLRQGLFVRLLASGRVTRLGGPITLVVLLNVDFFPFTLGEWLD